MSDTTDRMLEVLMTRRTALKAGVIGAGAAAGGFAVGNLRITPAAAQEAAGGRLVIGKPYETLLLDPHLSASQTSWEIQAVVYESLVFLDADLAPAPGLAESWETPDDRTYVFALRQGVMFHNGREMTADDVVYSLNRVLTHPETWWNVKMGPVLAPDPAEIDAAATAETAGTPTVVPTRIGLTVEATGPYEVTATLTEPYAPFLASLSGTTCSIVPGPEVENGDIDLTVDMVGTGPFQLVEHLEDQSWTFSAFPDYWLEGQPQIAELVWQITSDESARVAALRSGEIQLTMFENPTQLDLVKDDPTIATVQQTTTNYYILFVNGQRPELADERIRQAISAGIDRDQIRQVALFGRGTTTGPIAAGFTQLTTPLDQVPFYTRDVEQAKQLLAEAGAAEGYPLQLLVTPVLAATIPMAELIKAQLAEVGIEIEIVQRDIATFVDEYNTRGVAQLAISWWAGYSDPYLILLELASTAFAPTLGAVNPEIDDLISQAATTVDPTERLAVLKELEVAIATMANFQPLVTRDNFVAYRKDRLENVSFANGEGFGLPLWHRLQEMTLLPE